MLVPPVRGEGAVGVEPPTGAQTLRRRVPVVLRPAACQQHPVARLARGRDPDGVRLARVEPGRRQRDHVPVTAVLAQECGRVPEREVGFLGPRQLRVRREQRPAGDRTAVDGTPRELRRFHHRCADDPGAEDAARRAVDTGEAQCHRLGGRHDRPDRGHPLGDEAGCEPLERRRHRACAHRAQRCRSSREVPVPEPLEAGRLVGRHRLGREVGERVVRLVALPQPAGEVGHGRGCTTVRGAVSTGRRSAVTVFA